MLQAPKDIPDLGVYGDTRTDTDSQSVGSQSRSRASLRAERKGLDQHSRGARLDFRKGSPLGHTIEELDDRGLIDGGDTVPSYEASFKQRSRRPLEMRRRSSRLKGRTGEKHSPKIVNSFFHMVQVLVRRGVSFEDLLRQYDEEGSGVIEKGQFVKVCLSLGLPFGGRSLSLVYNRYSVSSQHVDYEALLQELYHGAGSNISSSNIRTASDDSLENGGTSTVLLELRRMLRESVHAFNKSFDDVYRMFSRWDIGGTGTVTATQFLRVLSHLHIVFSEQDQDLIVELFDSGGEGRVDFDSLLSFCCQSDNDNTQVDASQSPFTHKTYSYFGDDNTTSNSALSVGSVDNADTSVEKLDVSPSPDKPIAGPPLKVAVDASKIPAPMSSPERTARSNASGGAFQGGRPRPHTAGQDKRPSDGGSTGGGSRRESGVTRDHMDNGDHPSPVRYERQHDSSSHGSNSNNFHQGHGGGGNVESPTSRARRMVRPMTAAPRVPLTVSVPRQARANQDNVSAIDEFVVDVLSDDDVIDDDGDDALDLRSYEAPTTADTDTRHQAVSPGAERLHTDEYSAPRKEERDIRQFQSAAAAAMGSQPQRQQGDGHNSGNGNGSSFNNSNSNSSNNYYNNSNTNTNNNSNNNHSSNNSNINSPPTYRAEPAAALKMLRRDIIHRHQKSGKTLYDIFRTFDVLGNRYFDASDLQQTMLELALPIDEYQANEMIQLLGLDGEERVCFSEFAVFITDPDFPALADRVERIVAENYEKQGREYQLKLYNITMHGPPAGASAGGYDSSSSGPMGAPGSSSGGNNSSAVAAPSAITGFISKAAFEAAISELGVVASGNSKADNRGSIPLLSSVEVSRLCVRFDTHGRDLCSVAKFLRMVQNSPYWRTAEQNVILMEEAAEEAQTAREELEHHPGGYFTIGPPPGCLLTEELIDMAEYLGIRVLSEPYLLHIVESSVRAPVPEGWSIHTDKKGRNFFFHQRTGRSQWDHPADDDFRKLRDEARAQYSNQKNGTVPHQYDASQVSSQGPVQERDRERDRDRVSGPDEHAAAGRLRPLSAAGRGGASPAQTQPRDQQATHAAGAGQARHQGYQEYTPTDGHRSGQNSHYGSVSNISTPYADPRRQESAQQQQPQQQHRDQYQRQQQQQQQYQQQQQQQQLQHQQQYQYQQQQQQQYQHQYQQQEAEGWGQGQQQPDAVAIGDAVVQAMQGMDPAELLKLLNKNGDLLAAMGVSKASASNAANPNADFTPQRGGGGGGAGPGAGMNRHSSAPALRQQQPGTAVLMAPAAGASAKRATTPSGGRGGRVPPPLARSGSCRHNGSGKFDPQRGDRERCKAKQTHNWATPSAVDRALSVGKGNYGAAPPSGGDGGQQHRQYHGAREDDEEVELEMVTESTPVMHSTSRPKSGSGIRQTKLPAATTATASAAATDVEGRRTNERPKSSVQASRTMSGNGRGTAPPNTRGPSLDDIYGTKLLTRLDGLVARGHHSP
jgi:Ca2+-binding EF-hand superfamily protein